MRAGEKCVVCAETLPAQELIKNAPGRTLSAAPWLRYAEAKYLEDAVDLIVPADLPAEVEASVRAQAVLAFEALTCEGLARVDFFVTPEGRAIVNEVNTMPGFTSISMFPRMWQASGMTYPELVDHLISDALRRGTGLR